VGSGHPHRTEIAKEAVIANLVAGLTLGAAPVAMTVCKRRLPDLAPVVPRLTWINASRSQSGQAGHNSDVRQRKN
jgi:hypothetical protein